MDTKVRIELEAKEAITSVKDLRAAIKATKDEMVGLKEGSDEFKKAANKAGELQHQIDAINQSVRGASKDFGDMVGNITKVGAGITGAFQAAAGALNVMGVESEDVTKAIQKMQSVMAITQGLSSIDQGIKAFDKLKISIGNTSTGLGKFKKALIGTGLGALVVVLGSIIANWDEFTKSIGLSEKQMNKFGEVAGGVMNVLTGSIKSITLAITKAVSGDFSGAFESLKSGFDIKALYAEGVEKTITQREQEELEKRNAAQAEAHAKWVAQQEEKARLAEEAAKAEAAAIAEANRLANEQLDIRLEKNKRLEQTDAERLQNEIIIETERLALLDEGSLAYEKQLTLIHNLNEKLKDVSGLNTQADAIEEVVESTEEAASKLEDFQSGLSATNKIGQMAFGALGDTLGAFADMQDTSTKEGFEQQKKLQIANTTMNMLGGVMSAWTSAMSPANEWMTLPVQIAMGTAQTIATLAMGAAQIAKIKSTTFGGASTGAASASISNIAKTANTPVQYTRDIQGAETIGAIKDQRVYVIETDITATQKKVDIAETESVF